MNQHSFINRLLATLLMTGITCVGAMLVGCRPGYVEKVGTDTPQAPSHVPIVVTALTTGVPSKNIGFNYSVDNTTAPVRNFLIYRAVNVSPITAQVTLQDQLMPTPDNGGNPSPTPTPLANANVQAYKNNFIAFPGVTKGDRVLVIVVSVGGSKPDVYDIGSTICVVQ